MSAPKLCDKCGLWHRGSICGFGEVFTPEMLKALGVTHSESVTHGSVLHDNVRVTGQTAEVIAIADPLTPAQRRAKWRKAHPEKHAEQQRKHRGRSANR